MDTNIIIRYALQSDAEDLIKFNKAMALETEQLALDENILSPGVKKLIQNSNLGFYLVAIKENEIIGSLMVTSEWSDWRNGLFWWVQSVYVKPEYRRQGIYRQLYEFVKNEAAKSQNICGFRLYVEKNNFTAQSTYKAMGMHETHYRLWEELN